MIRPFLCAVLWILVALTVPLLIVDAATLSRSQRIRRLAGYGCSQRWIANHLGVSRYRVRATLAAA
jgi:DNA-binding transcriptional regulator LsrR (DeoR family)